MVNHRKRWLCCCLCPPDLLADASLPELYSANCCRAWRASARTESGRRSVSSVVWFVLLQAYLVCAWKFFAASGRDRKRESYEEKASNPCLENIASNHFYEQQALVFLFFALLLRYLKVIEPK